jgi:hypothetical protein
MNRMTVETTSRLGMLVPPPIRFAVLCDTGGFSKKMLLFINHFSSELDSVMAKEYLYFRSSFEFAGSRSRNVRVYLKVTKRAYECHLGTVYMLSVTLTVLRHGGWGKSNVF